MTVRIFDLRLKLSQSLRAIDMLNLMVTLALSNRERASPASREDKTPIIELQKKLGALSARTFDLLLITIEVEGELDTYGLAGRVASIQEDGATLEKKVNKLRQR